LAGRFDVAIPLLDEAITSKAAVGYVGNHLFEGTLLGHAYLAAGNFAQAEMIAANDLRSCRDRRARGSEAWTLWLLGEIHSHHDRPQVDEAREYYHSSFDLASELGMRPLVGHCHLGLARTDALAGKPSSAKDHLIMALTLYREMRMQYWPEHAEVALRTIV
jgi:sugar phosphate isomerase/epimerase